ncbi:hypothetical protein FK535_17480 [Mycolicibacterium sp. 018/SC-01/001]|uniref:hypothetical protein n=1 Tax=Mycolicibacterium sp. 018/SC-01/001 TaxID=2592069 RepID=UPI00117F913C|nr:hypothetical protein [Mycolicibacterium sp. 018/SC-01/001]TRW81246.1 hypothetical protein FK535_17480 [Mycolicibacterium sp. 018/SC-01/001]
MDADALYEMSGVVYTYDELVADVEAEAATLPPETWRSGVWDLNDYLIESMQVGIIKKLDPADDSDEQQ